MVTAVVSPDTRPVLFLTNHRGGGIGDFGLILGSHLKSAVGTMLTEETSIDGRGSLVQILKAATHRGPLIVNLGLTAWGRSVVRNFLGFVSLGVHRSLGFPTKVIVHHAIEMLDERETGYTITPVVRTGAHLALRCASNCEITVFSPRMLNLLRHDYSAASVRLVPLPGEPARMLANPAGRERPKVVTAGYWAPYKGIDLFIGLADRMRGRACFLLVGQPHLGLARDAAFRLQIDKWRSRALEAGVRVPGFLTPGELDSEFSGAVLGVLPYTSASGASASFQLFAERGVPVIATDLPEFRYLERSGAGVLIASPSVEALCAAVESVLDDPKLWEDLARRQVEFNKRYSWRSFVAGLLDNPTVREPNATS